MSANNYIELDVNKLTVSEKDAETSKLLGGEIKCHSLTEAFMKARDMQMEAEYGVHIVGELPVPDQGGSDAKRD